MRKFVTLASTAVIAAGTGWIGLGQPSFLHAEDAAMTVNAASNEKDMAAAKSETQAARGVLAKATEAALGEDAVRNLSDQLVAADRDRVRSGNVDATKLNATLTTLRNDWKAKYGSDFAIADPGMALDYNAKNSDGTPKPMNVTMGAENRSPARLDAAAGGDFTSRTAGGMAPAMGGTMGGETAEAHTEMKADANANTTNSVTDNTVGAGAANPAKPAGAEQAAIDNAPAHTPAVAGVQRSSDRPRTNVTNTPALDSGVAHAPGAGTNNPTGDTSATNGLPAQGPAAEGVQRSTDSPRITNNTSGMEADRAQAAAGAVEPANRGAMADKEMTTSGKPEVVYYTIPASHGSSMETLKLANEGGDWKIDIDDSIDGNKLAANLDKHLKKVVGMKDQWPADVAEAQRAVSHHVASALNDTSK